MALEDLKKINIKDLTPSDYNPRKISDKDFDKLKTSLKEFGLVDPIIINLNTKNIIGGHQRFDVLFNENPERDMVLLELGDIGWVFDETNLTIKDEAHEKALNLALNRMGGEFDIEKLDPILDELEELNLGELTGFDLDLEEIPYDIEVVYEDDDEEDDDDVDNYFFEDEFEGASNNHAQIKKEPPKDAERKISYGEIFKLKNNIILCGDPSDNDYIDQINDHEEKELFLEDDNLHLIKTIDLPVNYYITPNPKVINQLMEDYGVDELKPLK